MTKCGTCGCAWCSARPGSSCPVAICSSSVLTECALSTGGLLSHTGISGPSLHRRLNTPPGRRPGYVTPLPTRETARRPPASKLRAALYGYAFNPQRRSRTPDPLLHRPYSMNQASYDLSRLARNDLIRRIPGPQPLRPYPRRAAVRALLHQGLRPHPAPADGHGPAQRAPGTRRGARHPRPARRRLHHQGPPPRSSLTPRHGPHATAEPATGMPAGRRHAITCRDIQDKRKNPSTEGPLVPKVL